MSLIIELVTHPNNGIFFSTKKTKLSRNKKHEGAGQDGGFQASSSQVLMTHTFNPTQEAELRRIKV
jgi:hypothetical protein